MISLNPQPYKTLDPCYICRNVTNERLRRCVTSVFMLLDSSPFMSVVVTGDEVGLVKGMIDQACVRWDLVKGFAI